MPELPDLTYLEKRLPPLLRGRRINEVIVTEPVVVRMLLPGDFSGMLIGQSFREVRRHGPFLVFALSEGRELVVHPMLAGRFKMTAAHDQASASTCVSFGLDNEQTLHYLDDKKMGKVYLAAAGDYQRIPRFLEQGVDLLSSDFTLDYFRAQVKKSRKQVRVLIMDQTAVSAIGNAYADEILFAAGIHPKTFCYQLDEAAMANLYRAIVEVMRWGIAEVEKAAPALEGKFRDHLRVRHRQDQPCPNCGAKIRRAGVLGYDTFFCPTCQPLTREQFIDWRKIPRQD
jgi:formamidopyrimidine-DNA glycosylase